MPNPQPPSPNLQPPTPNLQPPLLSDGQRWTIVGLLAASITINLLDRQTLAVMAPLLREQWKWTNAQYGYIAVAFNLGMMLGQIPAGQLMDRVGTRIGLPIIFTAWSAICALHAIAGPGTALDSIATTLYGLIPGVPVVAAGLAGFIVLRFLMGLAECGNYTAGIKALAGLFPPATRSRAGGLFNAGAQLGSVIAPSLILSLLIVKLGVSWKAAFVIPPALGLLWLIPWFAVFPDKARMAAIAIKPAATGVQAAAVAGDVSLGRLIGNRKVLGLFLIRAFTGPITTFYWTWLPLYLKNGRGLTLFATGFLASVPNLIGMGGNIIGGFITDGFVAKMGADRGRKLAFVCAFSLGALSMTMPWIGNDYLAVLLMGLALFGNQWVAAAYIGTVGDVVPQQLAGRVNGIAGFGDNGAATLAVLFTGVIVDHYGWSKVFVGAGMLPLLAMLSVFFVLRRIEPATFD
jgi:ACS family hexuronate transporter-like MFS transporter